MKLNNKGFAISSIMYVILVFAVILISVTLALLSSRKLILDKIKKEAEDNIYGISYNSVLNTLKYEAIAYASSNNKQKDNIKIGDFETSVSQELLEHHELLDKYLTLSKSGYSYDVYLGQTKKITDISKPIDNMLGIVDYKIEGNSYQQTYTGKNLFDKSKSINVGIQEEIPQTYWVHTIYSTEEFKKMINKAGTYTLSYDIEFVDIPEYYEPVNSEADGGRYGIMLSTTDYKTIKVASKVGLKEEGFKEKIIKKFTLTEDDIANKEFGMYAYSHNYYTNSDKTTTVKANAIISNIQIEEGETATAYEPYVGGVASPNPQYPQEIKSVGDKTKNLLDIKNGILKNCTIEYLDNGFRLTSTSSTGYYEVPVNLIKGNAYKVSFDSLRTGTTGGGYNSVVETGGAITGDSNELNAIKYGVIYSASTQNYDIVALRFYANNGGSSGDSATFTNIQLEDGQTKTDYEPYGYKIPVKVSGNNIINPSQWFLGTNNNGFDVTTTNAISTYGENYVESTISAWNSMASEMYEIEKLSTFGFKVNKNMYVDDYQTFQVIIQYYDENQAKILNQVLLKEVIADTEYIINKSNLIVPSDAKYFRVGIVVRGQTIYNLKIYDMYMNIDNSIIYEPYVEPTTTNIYLNEPLHKINTYKDSLNFKNSNISKKIQKVDLTDAIDLYSWLDKEGVYFGELLDSKYSRILNALSNRTTIFDTDAKSASSMWLGVENKHIYWIGILDVLGLNTLEELNEWLKENPTHVLYATDLEPTNISTTLPTIQTNIGASIIDVDTSVLPSNVEFTIIEKIMKL